MKQITKERHEKATEEKFVHTLGTSRKILNELFKLQAEQREHDQKYHADIHILSVHQKVNHMVLHFAKYSGLMAEHEYEKEKCNKVLVDIFIISLSLANILNLNLSKAIETLEGDSSEFVTFTEGAKSTVQQVAIYTGRMAKASESIDHLEDYPYRTELQNNVTKICWLAINAANHAEINLKEAVHKRLIGVRKKNIFYQEARDA